MKKSVIVIAIMLVIAMSFLLGRTTSDITAFTILNPEAVNKQSMPSDRIENSNIRVFENRVVIYINDGYIANFTDTHSMEPLLDKNSQAIEIVPKSSDEIKVGDVISYINKDNETVIHRVVEIGYDSEWYAITKGDNNNINDPDKVRFEQVERVLIGILY